MLEDRLIESFTTSKAAASRRTPKEENMSTIGSVDAPIEIFGGLVSDMSPADLPHGVSPNCQDVVFGNGGVMTRPGLQALFGPLAGNPTVNYVKTYITPNETLRTMALDGAGNLYKESTPGTLTHDRERAGSERVRQFDDAFRQRIPGDQRRDDWE